MLNRRISYESAIDSCLVWGVKSYPARNNKKSLSNHIYYFFFLLGRLRFFKHTNISIKKLINRGYFRETKGDTRETKGTPLTFKLDGATAA